MKPGAPYFLIGLGALLLISAIVTFVLVPDLWTSIGPAQLPAGALILLGVVTGVALLVMGVRSMVKKK